MKKIAAVFLALAMSFALVTPAFAAGLSSAEQNLLSKFKDELNYWAANAQLDQDHIKQYYKEAESALTAVDLPDEGCNEFSGVIDDVHKLLVDSGASTRHDLWTHYSEIAQLVNNVGAKYSSLHVTVDASNKYAKVTWKDASGKTSTIATTAKTVKQTDFGLGQTLAVAGVSLAVLGGAYVVARKKQLFNA